MIVAATGVQRALLQAEFASLTFVELPGYRIKYGKNRAITILRLIVSIPKILIRIRQERTWLRRFVAHERVGLVISDSRYGLVAPGVFCILITHQLMIKTPFGRLADHLLQRMNYRLIGSFSRCWVPDVEGAGALAGELSNPVRKPSVPTRYIGWLSRMTPGDAVAEEVGLLVLLSGPEPQRTLFEQIVLREAAAVPCSIVLVRGLPGGGPALKDIPASMTVYDHLPVTALERLMAGARLVVARSGYSTVMDLARMGKRALLVPTPGQTEQEYLGRYLAENGWAIGVKQRHFSMGEALALVEGRGADWPKPEGSQALTEELVSALHQSRFSALG